MAPPLFVVPVGVGVVLVIVVGVVVVMVVVGCVFVTFTVVVRFTTVGCFVDVLLLLLFEISSAAITPATISATAPSTHGHGLLPPPPYGGGAWYCWP